MTTAERLRQLPGYFAFNAGVMFFIGLALQLTNERADIRLGVEELRVIGFAVLGAVLAMAAGFASVARIEFARREGAKFSLAWILPSVLVGLPLGRAVGAGAVDPEVFTAAGIGMTAALAGLAWLAIRARQEIKA